MALDRFEWLGRLDPVDGQPRDRRVQVLDLDHQVAEAAGLDNVLRGVVDQLEGHELVARELQHRQGAELGARHASLHLITESGVERERPLEVRNPEAEVQGPHDATGKSR